MKDHPTISRMPGGFTLVELMTVIAILSVLAAVAYPLINASLPKYRLRAAARELVIDFKRAKVEAIKRHQNVLIEFKPPSGTDGGSYELCVDDCTTGEKIASVAMPKDVRLTPNPDKNKYFNDNKRGKYDSRGLPPNLSDTGTICLSTTDGSRTYSIALSSSGAVRMY